MFTASWSKCITVYTSANWGKTTTTIYTSILRYFSLVHKSHSSCPLTVSKLSIVRLREGRGKALNPGTPEFFQFIFSFCATAEVVTLTASKLSVSQT